jgi:hypothetical protein
MNTRCQIPETSRNGSWRVCAAWFFGIFPLLNLLIPHHLPRNLSASDCDFGQY